MDNQEAKNKIKEVPWLEYQKYMPKAEAIYNSVYPIPRTTADIADRFNKIGNIIRILYST